LSSKRNTISKLKWLLLSIILLISILAPVIYFSNDPENEETHPVKPYFGISFCGNTAAEAKLLIDKTKDYTNLFVLQSGPISKNETAINEVCDYAVKSGLDFIVFFGWFDTDHPWQIPWLDYAKERWENRFLGLYFFDEPGGIQTDYDWLEIFHMIKEFDPESYRALEQYIQETANQTVTRDYEEAKKRFVEYINYHIQLNEVTNRSITVFTSDYALYWFDYLAGYDTVFVELGWNHNIPTHIGLCRGAATVQQKDWGTIIVWKARNLENDNEGIYKTGPEMYSDMITSYETGAKYIIIFNYPTNPPYNPYGILKDEHFNAIQQFWEHMQSHPEDYGKTETQAAIILPENYGWAFRNLNDRIWGYWGPDEKSQKIWELTQDLLNQYEYALDIVYDDPDFPVADIYPEIYYWNQTG
jgi:hypothetical protein